MQDSGDYIAKELMDALMQFRRLHFNMKPDSCIKPSEIILLYQISEINMDGIKVSELSDKMKVKSPTITQSINSLELYGYVERSVDLTDRRAVIIRITEKGKEFVAENQQKFIARIKGLVSFLGEENSKVLTELIAQMYIYFEKAK
jgi:DNA-binding MarR family transcriptional regulator